MIILDTNIVSETFRPDPSAAVIVWLDAQMWQKLAITSITAAELRAGVAQMPDGRRRQATSMMVESIIEHDFGGAVLSFDHRASRYYGEIRAARRSGGRPIETADAQIAAIAMSYDAELATRNTKDFADLGLRLINPWEV
ncbi:MULTISPECIES: type II toxin-antitoxin system VapC family toxin [Nesterenkonia]|uniref:type II toxin-antitoxin system VapC family toxin n=1 Tax=Nesterenkonia TaxID=57494 RepID=UPI000E72411C|nr:MULTISPECIES: type II toxin-antitoxin system VapC family toxin [Nesterenkonia]